MEFGDGAPVALPGHESLDDGGDVKMSEIEEGELVELISRTDLEDINAVIEEGELVDLISRTDLEDINAVISETGSHETKVSSASLDKNESGSKTQRRRKNKKKNKKKNNKNKGNNGTSSPNITDVNRFVINVCKRLREKKSYLVWTAVACLGVSVLSDLVKEVDAIQASGGQKTSNGKRLREGGGILWNIIKHREPDAYKEIMKQGKEFEKQLRQVSKRQPGTKEATSHRTTGATTHQTPPNYVVSKMPPVRFAPPEDGHPKDVRMPVRYDDLYGEEHHGEEHVEDIR